MERDMDLVRNILLEIENGRTVFNLMTAKVAEILGVPQEGAVSELESQKLEYHLNLLVDANYISIRAKLGGGEWNVKSITWEGHDFLDSVRDPEIWKMTKQGAKNAGGFSFDVLKTLAKALIKKKLEKHTGLELDI